MRYNVGKPQISFILEAPRALEDVSKVLEFGANKYARRDWLKGMPKEQIIDSLTRHLLKYINGELIDPESGCTHTGHILANAVFLSEFESRGDYNDK